MEDWEFRAALERHWAASDGGDFELEHQIYQENALLEYPQSGERIRGRRKIQESRFVQPNKKRFSVQRIIGSGVLAYDDAPSYAVSIMEFANGLVERETQYFAGPFEPSEWRAHLIDHS